MGKEEGSEASEAVGLRKEKEKTKKKRKDTKKKEKKRKDLWALRLGKEKGRALRLADEGWHTG